jgi:hypothetical protein
MESLKNALSHVKDIEADYWVRDDLIEKEAEQMVTKFGDGDSESDSCSSDSEPLSTLL